MPPKDELLRIVAEERLDQEPPVFPLAPIRGGLAVLWWVLRLYVVVMTAIMIVGFLRGMH